MHAHSEFPRRLSQVDLLPGRTFLCGIVALLLSLLQTANGFAQEEASREILRIGVIGLDTSHSPAFVKLLNDPGAAEELSGCRVVVAYPHGSPDIESSVSRIPQYTEDVKGLGVEIVDSIDELIEKVDCVLLETNDGRPHLEQAFPVLKAGKPVFIDKPLAGSLADCYAIFQLAEHFGTPLFSSSSLRYSSGVQAVRGGSVGRVIGCQAHSPCKLEATHPDLFWYGIHGVELLYTAMGEGCESVTRVRSAGTDVVVGRWQDGRIGTFRGIRDGEASYGGTAFGSEKIAELGKYEGYRPLVVEIVRFFRSGDEPIAASETLELYTFMEAADESKRRGYEPVLLAEVRKQAIAAAKEKVKELLAEAE